MPPPTPPEARNAARRAHPTFRDCSADEALSDNVKDLVRLFTVLPNAMGSFAGTRRPRSCCGGPSWEAQVSQGGGVNVRYRTGYKGRLVEEFQQLLARRLPYCRVRDAF